MDEFLNETLSQYPKVWDSYKIHNWKEIDPGVCTCTTGRFSSANDTLNDGHQLYYNILDSLSSSMNSSSLLHTYNLIKCRITYIWETMSQEPANLSSGGLKFV